MVMGFARVVVWAASVWAGADIGSAIRREREDTGVERIVLGAHFLAVCYDTLLGTERKRKVEGTGKNANYIPTSDRSIISD